MVEKKINSKFAEICQTRKVSSKLSDLLSSHHTTLSTGRVQIKTHKHPTSEISNIATSQLKVRPIVSGCNSPFDRITWLICHFLAPLMEIVPSHLKNTYDVLQKLQQIPKEDLAGRTFATADVEALYTNIVVQTAIDDVMDFATEHKSSLALYGFKLVDIHELLEITLLNSYFVYDRQVYHQLQGLFMGSRPAPIAATIRMWKLERLSVYTDLRIKPVFYGRFYDDLNTGSTTARKARLMCNAIEAQDKDHLIKLKVDYPESRDSYTPFLNTEVKIERDGTVNTRLFRKPQKKLLTLHTESHHSTAVK